MKRKIALLAALATGLLLLPVDNAMACSCAPSDPRDSLAESDGAFIGTFRESHPAEIPMPGAPTSSGDDTIYTFDVDEAVKGEFGDTIEVHSAADGASCGLEVQPGQDYGIYLTEDQGEWHSNLCRQTSPEELRKAAQPLPAPTGEGPPKLFIGGSFGEKQTIALDAKNRILGYGGGGRDAQRIEVCPRSSHIVELAYDFGDGRFHLITRKAKDLAVVRDTALPHLKGDRFGNQYPTALSCVSRNGGKVIVFSTDQDLPKATSYFMLVEGDTHKVLAKGTAQAAHFDGDRAVIRHTDNGRRLALQELRPARRTDLGRIPGKIPGPFALNPEATRVVGVSFPDYDQPDGKPIAWRFSLDGQILSHKPRGIANASEVLWWGKKVVVVPFSGEAVVLDQALAREASFDWYSYDAVVKGNYLYGVADGVLVRVALPGGPAKALLELPSPVTLSIASRR